MDLYSNFVLTVMAIALSTIVIKMSNPLVPPALAQGSCGDSQQNPCFVQGVHKISTGRYVNSMMVEIVQ